ncbi:MAG: exonuclease SbcCD subunit D C-terminal domain-containing protein [Acidobacteriota bacterium]|nr:exonuclease SbcCD subunit D C-terminal domain-containing protein [Acidobacteriota bacterium]
MRLLHTSDWHLGHTLHGFSREYEHRGFLSWLLRTLEQEAVDALLVTGDIFDTSNPPTWALEQYYRFLADAIKRMPTHFQIVIIGGNHDSAARLNAPTPLLDSMNIHVVGGVPRDEHGRLDVARMTIALKNRAGEIAAWVAAMPFIRVPDLPPRDPDSELDHFIAGVKTMYRELLSHVIGRCDQHHALIATGHCYMQGTRISEDSERKILGANKHALPLDLFPPRAAYTALGHLHLAQLVDKQGAVRYSGSPIPLSFSEDEYKHAVYVVSLEGPLLGDVREIRVPRLVPMKRMRGIPEADLDSVLAALDDLSPFAVEEERPLLEVSVKVSGPVPGLRQRVEKALESKEPRLLKLGLERQNSDHRPLATALPETTLKDMQPEIVFDRCYRHQNDGDPPEDLRTVFCELLASVRGAEQ